jgi:predicted Zn finger-like uncharacterized protein
VKFLCDQCKAKYQISDDKVAGKTVRMKCRKCGHLIEVRAAVTESSVATNAPSEPPGGTGSARPPPAKPSTIPKSPLATSLAQAKPPAPRPGVKPEGGLSTAFKSSIQTREDEAALLELSSADEWYAAINGVPVGPIRIGELRRKASLGAVNDDSLVWQEGMEEWRPVKTIPELAALMREAASSGRTSLVTPEPPNARSPSVLPPAPAGRPAPPQRPAPPRPLTEPPRQAATARSNVVPITSRLATAERLEEAPAPTSDRQLLAADPFATGGESAAPAATASSLTPAPAAAATFSSSISPATAAAAPASQQAPVIVQMPRQPNYAGIGMIIALPVFAAVAAWAIFFKQPPPPQAAAPPTIVTQYLPAPAAPTATDKGIEITDPSPTAKHAGAVAAAPKPSTSAPNLKALAPGLDLGGLAPSGPGPSGGPAPSGGGLSGDVVESTVRMHNTAVKRTCWERIGGGGATSANETVHIVIDGSGHVSSAHADGNNSTVGNCLEKELRNWTFPPSGGTTEVNLPFKFINQ